MGKTKYLVMDVDGTLTDGKLYIGHECEEIKAFNVKDGCGILLVLPEYNITPIIITSRASRIVENRCKELNIIDLYQGVKEKLLKLSEAVNGDLDQVAYVGDDLPDIPCMEAVKRAGGLALCPSDAIPEIKLLSDYVSGFKAGEGAVRDIINYIVHIQAKEDNVCIKRVIERILSGDYSDGIIEGNPYVVQEYSTKDEKDCIIESHRHHIDIQYMLEGHEVFKMYSSNGLTCLDKYNEESDAEYWKDGVVSAYNILGPGSLIVVYNGQPHKGAMMLDKSERVKKLVCKVSI